MISRREFMSRNGRADAAGDAILVGNDFTNAPTQEHAGTAAFDTKWIAQMWIHASDYSPAVPAGNSHAELIL
jgi:hypothetical protein